MTIFFLTRLQWRRLSKRRQPLFQREQLCISSGPVGLHAGWNNQFRAAAHDRKIRNEENEKQRRRRDMPIQSQVLTYTR